MCSSSDDVDDEDYVKKWKTQCVLPLMMVMTKTMWKNEKMENTMCSSSDDIDDEDQLCEKMENTMCSSYDDVDDEKMENTMCSFT